MGDIIFIGLANIWSKLTDRMREFYVGTLVNTPTPQPGCVDGVESNMWTYSIAAHEDEITHVSFGRRSDGEVLMHSLPAELQHSSPEAFY